MVTVHGSLDCIGGLMALTEVASGGLLLPDGSIHDTRPKDQVLVTNPAHRQAFARFHEVAQQYGLVVLCPRCDHAITGQNNDTPGAKTAVACRCREFLFVV
jgi:hypothetical protein